jgi:hypothetical protein
MLSEQTVLMAGPGGRRAGLAYAAGTATVLVVLAGVVLAVGSRLALPSAPHLDAGLDMAVGAILLASTFSRRQQPPPPPRSFAVGERGTTPEPAKLTLHVSTRTG